MTTHLPIGKTADELLAPCRECLPPGFVPTGKVFWLDFADPVNGADRVGFGSFDHPFRTIIFAISQCVSDRCDLIVMKPSHAQTSVAAHIVCNKAKLTILGLGNPWAGPYFQLGGYRFVITAPTSLINVRAWTTGGVSTNAFLVQASHTTLAYCSCFGNAAYPFLYGVIVEGDITDVRILRNRIRCDNDLGSNVTGVYLGPLALQERIAVIGNYFVGEFPKGGIYMHSATETVNDFEARGNLIYNGANTADDAGAINLTGTVNGVIEGNRGYVNEGAAGKAIVPSDCSCSKNYFTSDLTKSGVLEPAA